MAIRKEWSLLLLIHVHHIRIGVVISFCSSRIFGLWLIVVEVGKTAITIITSLGKGVSVLYRIRVVYQLKRVLAHERQGHTLIVARKGLEILSEMDRSILARLHSFHHSVIISTVVLTTVRFRSGIVTVSASVHWLCVAISGSFASLSQPFGNGFVASAKVGAGDVGLVGKVFGSGVYFFHLTDFYYDY